MARVLHSGDTSWEECPGRGGRGRFLHFLFSLFISSDHVARLDPETFYFQFHNLLYAYGRNCSYICYRVKRWKHRSPVSFDWGVFHNQVRAPGNSSHLFGALELQIQVPLALCPAKGGKSPGAGSGWANCRSFRILAQVVFPKL